MRVISVSIGCVVIACLGMADSFSGELERLGSILDEPIPGGASAATGSITVGGHISESLADGFADLHIPVWRPWGSSLFFNPRVFATDDSLERYSLGGGWRWLVQGPEVIIGANAYWDHLESGGGFEYEQLGAGAEILTRWVDARFNYYRPEEGMNYTGGCSSDVFEDGDDLVTTTHYRYSCWSHREAALRGYYGEIGFLVPGLDKFAELRLFGGYYNYEAASDDPFWEPSYEGWKARAELRLPPAVTLDVEYVDDAEIMGGNWTGGIRVTVPFEIGNVFRGKNPFEGIGEMFRPRRREFAERMAEMVVRSPRVVVIAEDSRATTEFEMKHYSYEPPTGSTNWTGGGGGAVIINSGGGTRIPEPIGGVLRILP